MISAHDGATPPRRRPGRHAHRSRLRACRVTSARMAALVASVRGPSERMLGQPNDRRRNVLLAAAPAVAPPITPAGATMLRSDAPPLDGRAVARNAWRRTDELAETLARAVASRSAQRGSSQRRLLQRVMLIDGTVGGAPARNVQMVGVEVAIGDNTHDQAASLYTSGMDGCASLVTRHGATLHLAHCPATSSVVQTEEARILGWFAHAPDEVIIVFGNDYKAAGWVGCASHPVEELLAASNYHGPVSRHYNANGFVVSPAGAVILDPPGGHLRAPVHAAAVAGGGGGKGCCTLF